MTHDKVRAGDFQTDMIFIDQIPHLVFEWDASKCGMMPSVAVSLDPEYLHPVKGWEEVDYIYDLPIEDPRVFH